MPDPCAFGDAIRRFFSEHAIDAFCITDISRIRAPADRHPRSILPSCRTLILFGIPMGNLVFSGTPEEQATETQRLIHTLDGVALSLRDLLAQAGVAAEAVLPFPLEIRDGIIRGRLSLKYCAADAGFGTIGENTLLINPVHGNRLLLAAVLTEQEIRPTPSPPSLPVCTHCHRCTVSCPAGAICDGKVSLDRCHALTTFLPAPIRPVLFRLMQNRWSARAIISMVNLAAPRLIHRIAIPVPCAACVTACPYFHKGER